MIKCNNSRWSTSGCLLLALTIVGGTWLVATLLFVTKVGLTLMSETLVDVRVL